MKFKVSILYLVSSLFLTAHSARAWDETVLDDLKILYNKYDSYYSQSACNATTGAIESALSILTYPISFRVAPNLILYTDDAVKDCNRSAAVMQRIYPAIYFLDEVERIYQDLAEVQVKKATVLKWIPKYISDQLSEISRSFGSNDDSLIHLIQLIHDENRSGMNDFMRKNQVKHGVPDYLIRIKGYLREALK